jgi:hypothetical protein
VTRSRLASAGLLAALLTGCAPTLAPPSPTATPEDRRRAEACHAQALEEAEQAVPYVKPAPAAAA